MQNFRRDLLRALKQLKFQLTHFDGERKATTVKGRFKNNSLDEALSTMESGELMKVMQSCGG